MIGITNIAEYIPENHRDNYKQAEGFGEARKFIDEKIGAVKLPIKDSKQETSDLAALAVEKLIKKSDLTRDMIDCLVVVTQNPDGRGLPHTAAIVQNKLSLSKNVAAFDISLGCSGYVYGLSVIKGFMDQAGLKCGILVTADPYSKIIDPHDKNTSLLFGDAATATLLTDRPKYSIGKGIYATDGSGASNLQVMDNTLHMNGRQVFNFAATQVPKQINALLAQENIDVTDVDRFILHQGSRFIVNTIAARFKNVNDRFIVGIEETGNTVSSSIPLLLRDSISDTNINRIVISGFGVGLSWASMLLTKVEY